MSPANNTVNMVVFSAEFGVYLCIFFKPNPDLHNLKKSSIFPRMGLYRFQFCIFWINVFVNILYSFLAWFSVFLSLNTRKG